MCQINPILLTSFQEALNIQHCQNPFYGGRINNGLHSSHPGGPKTEFNTPTHNLEITNVRLACVQLLENITQRFSMLNILIRVIAYWRGFISNCRNSKDNRQWTTLSTQHLEQSLTCCVKIVKQVSYAQEIKDLGWKQKVAVNISLKTLHSFMDNEGLIRFGENYNIPPFLIKQDIRKLYVQLINFKVTSLNIGLSTVQSLVCLMQWSIQPNI